MDKIILKALKFWGCHGVLPAEKDQPQTFVIDVSLLLDLRMAAEQDSVQASVDYSEVYLIVKRIVEDNTFNLIETLAEKISLQLLQDFTRLEEVEITVYKPDAPVDGQFEYMAVQVCRSRRDGG